MSNEKTELIDWRVEGHPFVIRYPARLMHDLAALAMSGFQRYPWGGVEIGGVLFGAQESDGVEVLEERPLDCEHSSGPSFELSAVDEQFLVEMLEMAKTDERLSQFAPVGFYHTVSHRDLALSEADLKLFEKFFPAAWQIALVIKRSKTDPPRFGFFFREADGSVQAFCSHREFALEPDGLGLPGSDQLTPATEPEPVRPRVTSRRSGTKKATAGEDTKAAAGRSDKAPVVQVRVLQRSLFEPESAFFDLSEVIADRDRGATEEAKTESTVPAEEPAYEELAPEPLPANDGQAAVESIQEEVSPTHNQSTIPAPLTGDEAPEVSSDPASQAVVAECGEAFSPLPNESALEEAPPEPVTAVDEQATPQPPDHEDATSGAIPGSESPPEEPVDDVQSALTAAVVPDPSGSQAPPKFIEPVAPRPAMFPTTAAGPVRAPSPTKPLPAHSGDGPEAPHVTFLGLRQDPFLLTPDPAFLYASDQHTAAIASLRYGVQSRKGFMSMTGPTGTGKTLVLECVIDHLSAGDIEFAYVFNAKLTVPQLFELIDYDLGLNCRVPTKTQVLIALNEHLIRRAESGSTTVLIVDDAQKLSNEVLEEIELLGNLETRRGALLQIMFAGQPEFEHRLNSPALRGLKQRIILRSRLRPLPPADTAHYIAARLATAGRPDQDIFPEPLLNAIHSKSRGIPRLINAVCGALLERCYLENSHRATTGMLDQVSEDFQLGP